MPGGVPEPAARLVPCPGLIILQVPVAVPDDGPLDIRIEALVCKEDIHLFDGISKGDGGNTGLPVVDLG